MKMKKWLKYSGLFAFIPAVTVPVVMLSSCGGDKKEDKKDGDDAQKPSNEKPVTTPETGENATVNLPILKQNAIVKGDVELKTYIDEFNAHGDLGWQADVLSNIIENVHEIWRAEKVEKFVLSESKGSTSWFTIKIFLKSNFNFAETKQNFWESADINYVNTNPNASGNASKTNPNASGDASKETPKETPKEAPKEQQPSAEPAQEPSTKATQSTSRVATLVNLTNNQTNLESATPSSQLNAEQVPLDTLVPASNGINSLQGSGEIGAVDVSTSNQPNSVSSADNQQLTNHHKNVTERSNQPLKDSSENSVCQPVDHEVHAETTCNPKLDNPTISSETINSETIELANEALESISSTVSQTNQDQTNHQSQLTNSEQEIVKSTVPVSREGISQPHNDASQSNNRTSLSSKEIVTPTPSTKKTEQLVSPKVVNQSAVSNPTANDSEVPVSSNQNALSDETATSSTAATRETVSSNEITNAVNATVEQLVSKVGQLEA